MKVLKIAFFLTQSMDSPSGLGRFGPIARELARRGHQVDVFALHPDFKSLQHRSIQDGEVAIHYVAPMHVKKSRSNKSYYQGWKFLQIVLQATVWLSWSALHTKADILLICKPHPMNSIACMLSGVFKGKTIYLDCDDFEAGVGHFTSDWQKSLVSAFEKWIPSHVTAVTTNTNFMKSKLISWGVSPEKVYYITNGVEINRFAPPDPDLLNFQRAELGIIGKQVISFIGTVGYASHPVYLLMDAFKVIHAQKPNTVLMIVGGGEDIDLLKSQANHLVINQAVHFTGRIPPQDVSLYYYLSDVTVDPVNDDDAARGRSPIKLFESWAAGVPFVTADVGDRLALLGSPMAGLIARPGDPSSLAECVIKVLDDHNLASAIRQLGLERVKQFSWENLTDSLEQLFFKNLPN